tara:strand:+ start:2751 stop:3755 length:1005 start_codon:yes stop_codon:yes gene_type:complete
MAFLDNSGDILLDAVLTDAGRQRMAKGQFKIVKFALGDEEINYELFNSDHVSGSAYFDLEIMQTPVLEAFTNNTSSMASKLLTITRNNILYLPKLKLNNLSPIANLGGNSGMSSAFPESYDKGYLLTATSRLEEDEFDLSKVTGVLTGVNPKNSNTVITVDQGLDTTGDPSSTIAIDNELIENQFLVQVDHRLLRVVHFEENAEESFSFVDDDQIATYYFSIDNKRITSIGTVPSSEKKDASGNLIGNVGKEQVFLGPLGNRFRFKLAAALNIQQSTALFDRLGPGVSSPHTVTGSKDINGSVIVASQFIDTLVRVTGVTTGYSLDIPIRILTK